MHEPNRRSALAVLGAAAGSIALAGCATPGAAPAELDLTSAAGQLDAFMRMRGTSDGRDTFANWWVTVFAQIPGERPRPIFKLDGFNVGRFVKLPDGGAEFITREVAYYKDIASDRVVDEWTNPFTNERNKVLHIDNDPVNSRWAAPKPGEAGRLPFMRSGDDVFMRLDVPLAYPNPLLPAEFPAESSGPVYIASEHFIFFARASDLANRALTSVPTTWAWTRTGPWLPWMKMGTRPGHLIYSGHGRKYLSFDELPADVRQLTLQRFPKYTKSPETYVSPNETSWTYYKKVMQKR